MLCDLRVVPVEPARRERLLAVLDEYARSMGHPFRSEDLLIEPWDGETWLGALMGHANQGWLFVNLIAVIPAARGQGVGSQLMHKAEALAGERALVGLWLDTFSWQAPGFYQGLGFTEVGRIPDHPPGEVRLFWAKRLDGGVLSLDRPALDRAGCLVPRPGTGDDDGRLFYRALHR